MNETVRDYCQTAGVTFTRCRSYRQNDQPGWHRRMARRHGGSSAIASSRAWRRRPHEHRTTSRQSGVRFPSNPTDRQWAPLEPLIPAAKPGGRPRNTDMRAALDALFYVLRTGCPWRYLPGAPFLPRSTIYNIFRQFRRVWADLGRTAHGFTRRIRARLQPNCRQRRRCQAGNPLLGLSGITEPTLNFDIASPWPVAPAPLTAASQPSRQLAVDSGNMPSQNKKRSINQIRIQYPFVKKAATIRAGHGG